MKPLHFLPLAALLVVAQAPSAFAATIPVSGTVEYGGVTQADRWSHLGPGIAIYPNTKGAPLPVAGAGLPLLAAAGLFHAWRRRRRG